MSNAAVRENLAELYRQLMDVRKSMLELQKGIEPTSIEDYELDTLDGKRRVSSFFGEHDTLFLIHNMGSHCVYCTLWADGFNGVIDHLQDRAGFVLTNPDSPDEQQEFAKSRGWRFPMASLGSSTLAADLGYYLGDGEFMPGVSVLKKLDDGSIAKVADTPFGPGDSYCAVFNLFDLIPGGSDDWQPKLAY